MVMVYIPGGIIAIGVTILIINSFRKARDNKLTNRRIRNSERFQNTIAAVKAKKDNEESNPTG